MDQIYRLQIVFVFIVDCVIGRKGYDVAVCCKQVLCSLFPTFSQSRFYRDTYDNVSLLIFFIIWIVLSFSYRVREKNSEVLSVVSDPQEVIRFSTFLAELFFRIRTAVSTKLSFVVLHISEQEGNPLWPFGGFLIQLILKLLTLPFDQSVMSIVNMLKVGCE